MWWRQQLNTPARALEAGLAQGAAFPRRNGGADALADRLARLCLFVAVFFASHAVLRAGDSNFTLTDFALLSALLLSVLSRRLDLRPFRSMTPAWLFGLALMLGGLFVSTIAYGDPLRWLNISSQYLVALFVVPTLLMARNSDTTKRLVAAYVLGVVLSEVIGIAAFFFLTPKDTQFISPNFLMFNWRLGAMAGEPNSNGATIAYALAMLIYVARVRLMRPRSAVLCGAILVWGLLLSASVTGFTSSLFAVIVTLAVLGLGRLLKVSLAVVVATGLYLGSGAPLPQAFEKRVAAAVQSGDLHKAGTFTDRSDLIREAWEQTGNHILVGMGADQYREVSDHQAPVHNLHLLIWNEGGAPAYFGLLLMLSLMVVFALAGLRERREEAAMALAVVGVFLIYSMSIPHMYARFWVLPVMLALSTIYARPMVVAVPIQPLPGQGRG